MQKEEISNFLVVGGSREGLDGESMNEDFS